jgi:hypothetical protein
MRKKTSTIIGLAIATILTAYISAVITPNQALAIGGSPAYAATLGQVNGLFGGPNGFPIHVIQSTQAHVGQVLGGITTTIHNSLKNHEDAGLSDVLTPHPGYWTPHP